MTPLAEIRSLVDSQAEDKGLWFDAETAPEAYLQRHLRKLHSWVERHTINDPPASKALTERDDGN